jgi:hypothetical protein
MSEPRHRGKEGRLGTSKSISWSTWMNFWSQSLICARCHPLFVEPEMRDAAAHFGRLLARVIGKVVAGRGGRLGILLVVLAPLENLCTRAYQISKAS